MNAQTKVIKTPASLFNALLKCSSVWTNDSFVFSGDYFDSERGGTHSY